MRVRSSKNDLCQVVYDDTIEDGFHGFVTKLDYFLQPSVQSALTVTEQENCDIFHSETEEKIYKTEQNQTKKHGKSLEKVVAKNPRQKPQ